MKVTTDHFEMMRDAMFATLTAHGLHPYMVKTSKEAWDVFHHAWIEKRLDGHDLYRYYTDSHLETAFRKIFKI